jgi:hypothetical protein
VVFLLIEFPLRQHKSPCLLLSAVLIFVDTLHTHLSFYLEVNFNFQLVSEQVHSVYDLFLECVPHLFVTSIFLLHILS